MHKSMRMRGLGCAFFLVLSPGTSLAGMDSPAAAQAAAARSTAVESISPSAEGGAPFFTLPTVDEERQVESDTLFAGASTTLLAFWTTHCAECVRRLETCQALQDWGRDDGLAVVGVNFDETPSTRIQLLARQATPRVIQLYDAGGRAAAAYGAGAHSFSVFVIDAAGILRSTHFDVSPDSLLDLRPHLKQMMDEALGSERGSTPGRTRPAGQTGSGESSRRPGLLEELGLLRQQRLEAHGWGRFRWMHIDTTGTDATGLYGEEVVPGSSFRHRLELELIYSISSRLQAGGLLWLSNEGEAVLRSGPDYLSTPWGSAFARYDTQGRLRRLGRFRTSLRAGYYDAHFTPLTLMRWDNDDSPISGGQRVQGCGVCGGQAGPAGFIRSESLEQLTPEYRFEGARWDLSLMERLDLTALYARPLVRYPGEVIQCGTIDQARMRYRQELYSGRLTAQISVPWVSDLAALSGTVLETRDFTDDWLCPVKPRYDPGEAVVLGSDLRLPLPMRMQASAEFARSRWQAEPEHISPEPEPIEASAARATFDFDIRPRGRILGLSLDDLTARAQVGYQHVGANFFSPYSALSYESNLRPSTDVTLPGLAGPRAWVRIDWGAIGLGAFLKLLDPVDEKADPGGGLPGGTRRMASIWIDGDVWTGGTLMGGWVLDEREPLAAQIVYHGLGKESRRTWIVDFQQELAPRCLLMLEGQFLDGTSRRAGTETDSGTRTVRCMIDVEF